MQRHYCHGRVACWWGIKVGYALIVEGKDLRWCDPSRFHILSAEVAKGQHVPSIGCKARSSISQIGAERWQPSSEEYLQTKPEHIHLKVPLHRTGCAEPD